MFKDNLELNEELTEQLQNVRKKSDKEAVLTKTQKTKFAKFQSSLFLVVQTQPDRGPGSAVKFFL